MIRTLAMNIGEYKAATIATPLLVIGEVLFEVMIPFGTAALIDQVKAGAELSTTIAYGAVLAGMALASLLFGAAAGLTCAKSANGFARNLRRNMFRNIQTFSFTTIDRFSTSSLVTRLTTDVQNVQMAFMQIIRTAIRCPLMLVMAFTVSYIMGGWLSFIFLAVVPPLAFALIGIIRKVHPIFKRIFHKYDALNESAEENLSGIRVVKSYVRESYEKEKFERAAEEVRADFTRAERILAMNQPLMNFAVYCVIVFVIGIGSYAIISTKGELIDVGQFSSLITYGFMILMSLMMISMVFAQIVIAEEGAARICEVLEATTDINQPEAPATEIADGSIDFDHVTFSYYGDPDRAALVDIDLHIESGETIGVIGSTGSSKSSLVQLVPRLYDVTEGAVRVGGRDVREYDLDALRNDVAMVLQKNVLFSGTIAENLALGQRGSDRRGDRRGGAPGAGQRVRPGLRGRLRPQDRAGRHQRLRRPEAAPLHRPRAAQAPQDLDLGRLHQRRRHQDRQAYPRGHEGLHPRHHEDHHRPAHELGRGCRPDRRHGRGAHRRRRNARRAAPQLRDLPRGLHLPEQGEPRRARARRARRRRRGRRGGEPAGPRHRYGGDRP